MDKSRRHFLKAAGLTGLSVAGGAAVGVSALAGDSRTEPSEESLEGTRWAMVIDLEKCQKEQGCTKCSAVCHSLHNVPDFAEPKHEVKWIWKEGFYHTFPDEINDYSDEELKHKTLPVLCNHCDNPPCVRVCPTQATFRRSDGLVVMDEHRCIGCRYCIVGCPYGSRSFNWFAPRDHIKELNPDYPTRTRGVVEKCTFCAERLVKGEIPACVEACSKTGPGAMTFGDIEDPNSEVRKLVQSGRAIRRKPGLGTRPQVYYLV